MSNSYNIDSLPKRWRALQTDSLAITGARIIDPSGNIDTVADITIEKGVISSIGKLPAGWQGEVINAKGWIVCPGLFDMHVHLREPGYEHKETVKSGCAAAAAGGFTGIACMPNTIPAIDNPGIVNFIREQAKGQAVDVFPIAAVTRGREGKALSEMAELADAGVMAFSDDGAPVATADIMRRALEYSRMLNRVIIEHCEEPALTAGGIMHECALSSRLGLSGWPSVGEEIAVQRDIALAEYTGGKLHIAHISTAKAVELLRQAKYQGINVTAEVAPHHLSLTCESLSGYDSLFKVNPPLREDSDCKALIEALADGTIDAIATDHAPHADDEKEVELVAAPFGMLGLETALAVIYTKFVIPGQLSLNRMIDAMAVKPRRILNLPIAGIKAGNVANITLFNPDEVWTVDRSSLNSKSHNTPYDGWKLTGRAKAIINSGLGTISEF